MSLRLRVVAAIALTLLLGSLAGTGLALWRARAALDAELTAAMTGGRQTVASAFEDLPNSDHPARDLAQLVATFNGNRHVRAAWVDAAGQRHATSLSTPVAPAPGWFAGLLGGDTAPVAIGAPVRGFGAVVLTPAPAADVAAIWAQFLELVLVLGAVFVAGSALVWLTVGRALRPLADLSAAFARIGGGDYDAQVRAEGPAELARLARGVNDMAARLAAIHGRNRALEEQLLTLQDEERADLARDLHDEIGPHLFAVNLDAALVGRLVDEGRTDEAQAQVRAIQAAVAHMQRLVRDILTRLRPTPLVELGLAAAVQDLVAFWRARHPQIAFELALPDDEAVPEAAREPLYRVVQEGLSNAVRHAQARRIGVTVTVTAGEAVARVTDDGPGGDPASDAGFGLMGMRERVTAAGGVLDVDRGAGGWVLTARIPAQEAA